MPKFTCVLGRLRTDDEYGHGTLTLNIGGVVVTVQVEYIGGGVEEITVTYPKEATVTFERDD